MAKKVDNRTPEEIAREVYLRNYEKGIKKSTAVIMDGNVGGNANLEGESIVMQGVNIGGKTTARKFNVLEDVSGAKGFEAVNKTGEAIKDTRIAALGVGQSIVENVVGKPLEFVSEIFKTGAITLDAANAMALSLGKGAGVFVEKTLEGMASVAKETGLGISKIETAAFDATGKTIESVGSFIETTLKCGGQIIYDTCKFVNKGVLQSTAKIVSSTGEALGTVITTGVDVLEATKNATSNILKGTANAVGNIAVGASEIIAGTAESVKDGAVAVNNFNKEAFNNINTSLKNRQASKNMEEHENTALHVAIQDQKLHKEAVRDSAEYRYADSDGKNWTVYNKNRYSDAMGRLKTEVQNTRNAGGMGR